MTQTRPQPVRRIAPAPTRGSAAPPRPGCPPTAAGLLAVQRAAGNRATAQLIVQRQAGDAGPVGLGRGGVWTPVDHTIPITGLPAIDKLRSRLAGWPVEVADASLNLKGSLAQGTSGTADARALIGSPSKTGVRVDVGLLSARALDLGPVKTSLEPSLSIKGGWELTAGKTALSATVAGMMLGSTVTATLSIVELKWDDKTLAANNGRPTGSVLAGSVGGGRRLLFTYQDGSGVSHTFDGSATMTVRFTPNWSVLGRHILRSVGSVGPALVPLAAVAGLAGLIWSGYVDARHQQQVAAQTRAVARDLIRAGDIYAGRMLDQEPGGGGGAGARATARADTDLNGVLARFQLARGQYLGALDLEDRRTGLFIRLSRDYTQGALRTFEGQMRDRVAAWHREHWLVTFLSGRYSSDTMALVERVVDIEVANHGRPVLR